MQHTVLTSYLLTSALGHDYGVLDAPGLQSAPSYVMQIVGPSFKTFNWADGSPGLPSIAVIFAIAERYQMRELL